MPTTFLVSENELVELKKTGAVTILKESAGGIDLIASITHLKYGVEEVRVVVIDMDPRPELGERLNPGQKSNISVRIARLNEKWD